MVEQHSKDYKLTAVKYYLTHNKTMRNVCIKGKYYVDKDSYYGSCLRYIHNENFHHTIQFIRDLCNKIIDYVLYKDLKGGLKTQNILDFYNKSIKDKYKNYLIIMDNAVIHRSKQIRELIEQTDNSLLYSVPYHPETNAIEEFFSQLKHYIKKKSPNTYEDIERVIKEIINNKIKREHLTNYLKHSYRMYKK